MSEILKPGEAVQTAAEPQPAAELAPAAAPAMHAAARISPFMPRSFGEMRELAALAFASGLLPEAIDREEAAFVIIATGIELGLSPMQALRGIHVIDGKPILAADLIVALCKRSPECLFFQIIETSSERATYKTQRRGDPDPTSLTWTLEDAKRAGLADRNTRRKHPAAMLRARCAAALARAVFPDVALGLYEESEGEEIRGNLAPPAARAEDQTIPTLLDIAIEMGLAGSKGELDACVASLRALQLPAENPWRAKMGRLLAGRVKALGLGRKTPPPAPAPEVAPEGDPDALRAAQEAPEPPPPDDPPAERPAPAAGHPAELFDRAAARRGDPPQVPQGEGAGVDDEAYQRHLEALDKGKGAGPDVAKKIRRALDDDCRSGGLTHEQALELHDLFAKTFPDYGKAPAAAPAPARRRSRSGPAAEKEQRQEADWRRGFLQQQLSLAKKSAPEGDHPHLEEAVRLLLDASDLTGITWVEQQARGWALSTKGAESLALLIQIRRGHLLEEGGAA
jgi:hypothetical protein